MTIVLLVVCLLLAVGFAAFQFSQAKRWRETAKEASAESERRRVELEQANRTAIQQAAESSKNRELAEAQWKLLVQAQNQLEDKFRALAAEALQNNSQLLFERSRDQLEHLVTPVSDSLRRFEEQVQAI